MHLADTFPRSCARLLYIKYLFCRLNGALILPQVPLGSDMSPSKMRFVGYGLALGRNDLLTTITERRLYSL